jgi:hypothetical protein
VTVAGLSSPLTRSSDQLLYARSPYELACKAGSQRWLSPYELVSFLAGVSIGCYLRAPRELVRRAHSAEFHHRSCDIHGLRFRENVDRHLLERPTTLACAGRTPPYYTRLRMEECHTRGGGAVVGYALCPVLAASRLLACRHL